MTTKPIFTAVSFAKVPLVEQGPLAQKLVALGWEWSANDADWCAHFRKEFPEGVTGAEVEAEIRSVMGDYYMSSDEITRRAEEWRAKLK
jgi:hypothetical protein